MINLLALCRWTRLGRLGLYEREDILASGDTIYAVATKYDDQGKKTLQSMTYEEGDLKAALVEGRLATSNDILYLISPWDVVEIRTPDGKGGYNQVRTNAEPPEDGDLSNFHEEIAKLYADPSTSGYPKGSYASAIYAAPEAGSTAPLVMLAHRDGPDDDWTVGPREPAGKRTGPIANDLYYNKPF